MPQAPGPRIRPALDPDLEGVLDLWRAADVHPTPTDDLAGLRTLLARDPEALLIVDDGGEVVAGLVAGFDGWRANLYRLAVRPSHRRRGLGRALVVAAAGRLRARGARRLSAWVMADDERAMAFWASLQPDGLRRDTTKARWILTLDGPPSAEF